MLAMSLGPYPFAGPIVTSDGRTDIGRACAPGTNDVALISRAIDAGNRNGVARTTVSAPDANERNVAFAARPAEASVPVRMRCLRFGDTATVNP